MLIGYLPASMVALTNLKYLFLLYPSLPPPPLLLPLPTPHPPSSSNSSHPTAHHSLPSQWLHTKPRRADSVKSPPPSPPVVLPPAVSTPPSLPSPTPPSLPSPTPPSLPSPAPPTPTISPPSTEPSPAPPASPPSSSGLSVGAIAGIAVAGSTSGSKDPSGQALTGTAGAVGGPAVCRQYRLDVLAAATGMWAEANKIGSGGFGDVYRAEDPADPSTLWAVKRAKVLTNDFRREVNEMASKHHPHLVRLLGFCIDVNEATEQTEQILIYEFMPNGDLERWLGPGATQPLSLLQRLDVMIGVAEGLQYLHSFGIVHRDIKPANILIDRNMQAKVADFGLVRMGEGTTVGATRVMGTPGYVDPAYFKSQKATPMADVHSFGVVMLTILTARKAIYNSDDNQINLKQWVAPFVAANDGVTFKDPSLEAPPDIILRLARLALSCTAMPTVLRPNMIKVLAELEALREEVRGATGDQMARRIDREIDDTHGHDLEEEVANAIRIGSSGGGVSGERRP
ncbi:unnamed protein product [Closterium sp. NIES-64]|nr:unnamed protein product [Closterium sp. NIES-64]